LDIGSKDINATEQGLSLRALFAEADYYGIDTQDGPGVDAVIDARDYDGMARFDLVVSTEALEHCPDPESIIACAWRALAPGGELLITAAAPERQPHNCDGTGYSGIEHYANIDPDQLRAWLADWEDVDVVHQPNLGDVYGRAMKPKPKKRRAMSDQGDH
jgi:SAM-dependent methyltransferase